MPTYIRKGIDVYIKVLLHVKLFKADYSVCHLAYIKYEGWNFNSCHY